MLHGWRGWHIKGYWAWREKTKIFLHFSSSFPILWKYCFQHSSLFTNDWKYFLFPAHLMDFPLSLQKILISGFCFWWLRKTTSTLQLIARMEHQELCILLGCPACTRKQMPWLVHLVHFLVHPMLGSRYCLTAPVHAGLIHVNERELEDKN